MNRRSIRFASLALLAALTPLPSALGDPAPGGKSPQEATMQTIRDIRNVGTAMFAWYKAEMEPRRSPEAPNSNPDPKEVDMAAIPVISREELAKVLVPKYLAAIPEADGWGHAYEFRLNTQDPNAQHVMGLRSAGRDGQFSGNRYEIGEFLPSEFDQDVPWMDGFFVRWPGKG